MELIKNTNKRMYLVMALYALFSFLSPVSQFIIIIPCTLLAVSVMMFDDSRLLCILSFASCYMFCAGIVPLFLIMFDIVMTLLIVKKLILAIKSGNKKTIRFIVVMIVFAMVLTLYGLIVTKGHFYKFSQGIGILLILANLYLLDKVDIKKIIQVLSIGLIISTTMSLIAYVSGLYIELPFAYDSITGIRFQAYFANINALAMYCSLCQTAILSLVILKKLDFKKWIVVLCITTLIGLATFSKTFILLTLISYFLASIVGFIKSENKKEYIKLLLIALVVVGLIIFIFNQYIVTIIKRFLDNESYSGSALNVATTGRVDIWKWYIEKWTSSPLYVLFGCGITADNINQRTAHNLYISVLYKFGIVGSILLIAGFVWVLKNKGVARNIAKYLPIVLILTNGLSEDIACSLYTSFPILIAMLFMLRGNKNNSKENN